MKVADLSTGPDWLVWIFVIILAIISIVLISGHGGWLIAGYNMASKEEKAKYNEKKTMPNNGNRNVHYNNSSFNYGAVGKYFTSVFYICFTGYYFG